MALIRKSSSSSGGGGWLAGLLGSREIERRVDENFPTWQEFSEQKMTEAQEREEADRRLDLPPHRIYVSSPLHGNFLYFVLICIGLALGFASPPLAPVLVYAAIAVAMVLAVFFVFRDAIFFHMEGLRLEGDADMINKHTRGPKDERESKGLNFLRSLGRKQHNSKVFRSRLLQIHYQNVLRTFEQGNRRTWVDQDASIGDLQTLLSQRGMKLVWTVIEMLPQLGLLGTLIGLMRMFLAFRPNTGSPELEVLAGFATALGTTVMANIFVLVLRPLYMRNERTMNEILSTIQSLMAMFILPTQQTVLERTLATGYGRSSLPTPATAMIGTGSGINEARLYHTLEELTHALSEFTVVQQQVDSGTMARETAQIAQDVKSTLRAFQDAVDGKQIAQQQRAMEQLGEAVHGLAANLSRVQAGPAGQGGSERIEHDLTQLRVMTHDTLVLLEQIAARMEPAPGRKGRLLSTERGVRAQVFGRGTAPGLTDLDEGTGAATPEDEEAVKIRLFTERS
ncbi:MAG TPA: MotA/TolQ/ExbB proton channel family protein [bacterium]|nr:MotA/TolQ/ExbB proton channel family protein [bacterium]